MKFTDTTSRLHVPTDNVGAAGEQQATYAAADAATSAVSQPAISFSPPRRQNLRRSSKAPAVPNKNLARKRKDRAATPSDDDFVDPPALVTKASKPANRKSKKGNINSYKKICPNYKCAPNQIILAKESLSKVAKDKLKEYAFGVFLDLKLKSLENTKLLMFLMDRLDHKTLTLEIAIDKRLKITTHSIQCVLGLPDRGTNIVVPGKHIQKKALCELKRKLGVDQSEDVKVQDLIVQIAKDKEGDDFTIRCFVMILLNKLLLPGTCDYITGKEAALTEDITKLRSVNWAQLIFDDIAYASKSWHSKKTGATSPSIHGCVLFLVVYYLDNLLGEPSTNPIVTPRVTNITREEMLSLIDQDKIVLDGVETFGALPLRSQLGTCYMEGVAPPTRGTPPTSSDIPSRSHSAPPAPIVSMHHHLAGCFDHLSEAQQLAAMSALRRCDDDIHRLMLNICDRQMMAVEEIKCIVRDDRSNAPPPPPSDKAAPTAAQLPLSGVETDSSLHEERQHPCPTTDVANSVNVMLNEGRDNVLDTGDLSYTQILMAADLERFPKSQQDAFLAGLFGSQWNSQCIYNDPSHEVVTNGVCKTCYDNGEMGDLHDEGNTDEEPVDSFASADEDTDEEETEPTNEIISSKIGDTNLGMDHVHDLHPKVDAASQAGLLASHKTHVLSPLRNMSSGFQAPVYDETPKQQHEPLTTSARGTANLTQSWEPSQKLPDVEHVPPIVFDKTPDHAIGSPTRFVNVTKNVMQPSEESHQLRDAAMKKMVNQHEHVRPPMFDQTPEHLRPENLAQASEWTPQHSDLISSPSKKMSTARKTQSNVDDYPHVFFGSQPPITRRRPKQSRSEPLSVFMFPLNLIDCSIFIGDAAKVRDIVISDKSLKKVNLISNASLGVSTIGEDLADCFRDNETILIEIMNIFTECLRQDEKLHPTQWRGHTLFLSWTLGSLLNCEELHKGQVYNSHTTATLLAEHLHGIDPKEINQILWTYHHSNHFSVYCVNLEHTRIDVLDSIDWSERFSSFKERNFPWGHRSIERLSEAFHTITGGEFQDFSRWPIWSKDVPRQQGNDCAIFTTKFLRHYDGEVGQLRCTIYPANASQYRDEVLSYILFHELNETNPLPEPLEKFRRRKN